MSWLAKALVGWLGLVATMVALGAVREAWLAPRLGERAAHVAGTLLACAAILAVSRPLVRWIRPDRRRAWLVGGLWVALAFAFEVVFFHWVRGVPWRELLFDQDPRRGRITSLVWAATLFAPPLWTALGRRRG